MTYPVNNQGTQPADVPTSPCELARNAHYVTEGFYRTRQKYKNLPRFNALLGIYLEALQEVEEVFFAILESRVISTARKAQLDIIGRILGLGRGSWDDDEYRVYLKVQLRILRSSGTANEIIAALRLILSTLHLREYYPAALEIDMTVTADVSGAQVANIARRMKSAGVRVDTFATTDTAFQFGSDDDQIDASHGFADEGETSGGQLAAVYQ